MQTHNKEKRQQQRDAENFKATASHELRTPIKMCIFILSDLIAQLEGMLDNQKYKHVINMLTMIRS